ncbi:hypothetical protein HAX54_040175 [Datura stramonium]|uniref:Uncharacterized protein n=1 Tax=Datura stramonium TaxID=4076 RepID=A0ABS8VQD2_DATST|nr:hypothetical protein [Datura stramonium]
MKRRWTHTKCWWVAGVKQKIGPTGPAPMLNLRFAGLDRGLAGVAQVGGSGLKPQFTLAHQPAFHRIRPVTRSESGGRDGEVKKMVKEMEVYR